MNGSFAPGAVIRLASAYALSRPTWTSQTLEDSRWSETTLPGRERTSARCSNYTRADPIFRLRQPSNAQGRRCRGDPL